MQNHLKCMTRFFKAVYRAHPAKALLPQDISIPDVLGRRQVRISPVAAGHTSEMQTRTILPCNMPAFWTSLRGISRIHNLRPNTLLGKLVACLELQGRIGPATNSLSQVLTLFKRGLSDIAKVFEHDHPSTDLFRVLSQGLGGNMQKMFRNGPFAVCQSLQKTMGRPGTYGLNRTPSKSDTFSQVIKFSTGKEKSFSVG